MQRVTLQDMTWSHRGCDLKQNSEQDSPIPQGFVIASEAKHSSRGEFYLFNGRLLRGYRPSQ